MVILNKLVVVVVVVEFLELDAFEILTANEKMNRHMSTRNASRWVSDIARLPTGNPGSLFGSRAGFMGFTT